MGRLDYLVKLGYDWLLDNKQHLLFNLLLYLREHQISTPALLDYLIAPIMYQVGVAYQEGRLSIGDEHRITHCIRDMLIQYQGHYRVTDTSSRGKAQTAIIGCARNQNHELGAIMARLVLEEHGWQVIYMGANVPTEEFAQQQISHQASLICIALMIPMTETDAQHINSLLAHMYRKDQPYELAFGGPLRINPTPYSNGPPVYHFSSMQSFSTWLEEKESKALSEKC